MTKQITDQDFEAEVLKSSKPVVVDFFAEWCSPCKAMAPALDAVSEEMGDVTIVKVDVDANPEVTNKYQIQAMPTLMMFKDGDVTARHQGALVQKSKLEAWIKTSMEA